MIEGWPAILVGDARDPNASRRYVILLEWSGDRLRDVRDFRDARYIVDGVEISILRE